tara:strand:- start:831 stop:1433 length:603 start_codon:yes stop_codon:yes gene_type:complete
MAVVSNGTTLIDAGAVAAGVPSGAFKLISSQTASSSANISFTSGIDSTYKEYIFTFIDIHPATDSVYFSFQGNAAGGSGFNETITSTFFVAQNSESASGGEIGYSSGRHQAQGTAIQNISDTIGNDSDQTLSGSLHLFNPSNTTFVKNFMAKTQIAHPSDFSMNCFTAGYFNTTSAIDEIQFSMSSGNIDAGTIKLYGVV